LHPRENATRPQIAKIFTVGKGRLLSRPYFPLACLKRALGNSIYYFIKNQMASSRETRWITP
jgi:hypothetical protein